MTDLISRLQSLTAPSREIDGEIALANGWRQLSHDLWLDDGGQCHTEPPRYTESLDAALTLAPGSYGWTVFLCNPPGDGSEFGAMLGRKPSFGPLAWPSVRGTGANPAIALLIAIMEAKEAAALSVKEE